MSCNNCETSHENKKPETIPYIVHEAVIDKIERRHKEETDLIQKNHKEETERTENHCKKWMIAFFVALALFFVTNVGWIIYESQFETISYTQDGEGINNVNIGEQGDLNNGTESNDQGQEKQ
jgi:hypothetical protein